MPKSFIVYTFKTGGDFMKLLQFFLTVTLLTNALQLLAMKKRLVSKVQADLQPSSRVRSEAFHENDFVLKDDWEANIISALNLQRRDSQNCVRVKASDESASVVDLNSIDISFKSDKSDELKK